MTRAAALREAGLVLGWFVVLGVLGGVSWWLVTPLAEWTRTAKSASMDELNLGVTVAADGWFFVIGAVGGLVSGFLLTAWRRRDPLLTVLLVAGGAGLASLVTSLVGHTLGPGPVHEALAQARVGQMVPVQLEVHAPGVYLAWPVAALFTALAVLWGTREESARVESPDSDAEPARTE